MEKAVNFETSTSSKTRRMLLKGIKQETNTLELFRPRPRGFDLVMHQTLYVYIK